MFDRTKPCTSCPFRIKGGVRYLGRDRAQEIADSLLTGKTFTCHDDLDLKESQRNHCVGAMLILENQNKPNQMMRIGERIGLYDRHVLRGAEFVFDDFEEWIEVQDGSTQETNARELEAIHSSNLQAEDGANLPEDDSDRSGG